MINPIILLLLSTLCPQSVFVPRNWVCQTVDEPVRTVRVVYEQRVPEYRGDTARNCHGQISAELIAIMRQIRLWQTRKYKEVNSYRVKEMISTLLIIWYGTVTGEEPEVIDRNTLLSRQWKYSYTTRMLTQQDKEEAALLIVVILNKLDCWSNIDVRKMIAGNHRLDTALCRWRERDILDESVYPHGFCGNRVREAKHKPFILGEAKSPIDLGLVRSNPFDSIEELDRQLERVICGGAFVQEDRVETLTGFVLEGTAFKGEA